MSPEKHKTRFNLGQEKGAIRGKGDWKQKCIIIQHKPKNLESSSNWKNSSLEDSFKITQLRPFTQSLVVKFKTKKEDVDHGGPSETLSSLEELQSRVDEVEPCNPPLHQKKCSPKLLKSQRCALFLPTCFNKPRNVMRALQT